MTSLAAWWSARPALRLQPAPIWASAIWLLLVGGALLAQPPVYGVDSRFLSAAWWLWSEPEGAGIRFAGEPPLLYWLVAAGWSLVGVSETWARLVAPLFGLAMLFIIGQVAALLWPKRAEAQMTAPILLVGFGGFASFAALTVPDALVACFTLGGLASLAIALRSRPAIGWAGFALCLGFAMLSKGTIGALHLLPTALVAPILWHAARPRPQAWYGGLAVALALALAISLPWLLAPGGDGFLRLTTLPGSQLDRPDPRPWYWLLLLAPVLLYPWFWWKPLLRAWQRQRRMPPDDGLRLVGAQILVSIAACLATESRVAHGLLPALPMLALLIARLLTVQENKPKDYHAALPALPVLLVGLLFFMLNIVPFAHLDAVWREFVSPTGLPIWLGGTGLLSGLLLIGGGWLLGQAALRAFVARLVQLALFPALVATAINIEFATSLKEFFDPKPVATRLQALELAGRPVAVYGVYRGEYDLPGRLTTPLTRLTDAGGVLGWAAQHPDGVVISYFQGSTLRLPTRPLMLGAAGDDWVALWEAGDVVESGGALLANRF
jgi:hypothetical protein